MRPRSAALAALWAFNHGPAHKKNHLCLYVALVDNHKERNREDMISFLLFNFIFHCIFFNWLGIKCMLTHQFYYLSTVSHIQWRFFRQFSIFNRDLLFYYVLSLISLVIQIYLFWYFSDYIYIYFLEYI